MAEGIEADQAGAAAKGAQPAVIREFLATVLGDPDAMREFLSAVLQEPAIMRQLVAGDVERAIDTEAAIAELSEKAVALDRLADTRGSLCITDGAKILGVPPRRFSHWLMGNSWIYRRERSGAYAAFQSKLDAGLLHQKITRLTRTDGSEKVVEQIRITTKGLAKLAAALGKTI